jgi:hypothetical protein
MRNDAIFWIIFDCVVFSCGCLLWWVCRGRHKCRDRFRKKHEPVVVEPVFVSQESICTFNDKGEVIIGMPPPRSLIKSANKK